MRYYVIAGEASGDLQGRVLLDALRDADPAAVFRGIGGDKMESVGLESFARVEEMAYMGFEKILVQLPRLIQLQRRCRQDLLNFQPDALILIDSSGFNLPMLAFAHRRHIKVFYYIPPKVWAWGKFRVKRLRALTAIYSILPFEKQFFRQNGIRRVRYIGNPLYGLVAHYKATHSDSPKSVQGEVALLPGSRIQEVKSNAGVFAQIARAFPNVNFSVAGMRAIPDIYYTPLMLCPNVSLHYNQTYSLLASAKAAVVTVGTAVLEASLWHVPQVAYYRVTPFLMVMKTLFLLTPYVSLVNLIAGKSVIKEIVGVRPQLHALQGELQRLLNDQAYRKRIQKEYQKVNAKLQEPNGPQKAAEDLLKRIR